MYIFQTVIGIIFSGELSASSNGSNFLFINDRGVDRYQYPTDESEINRAKANYGESVEDKQSRVVLFLFEESGDRYNVIHDLKKSNRENSIMSRCNE